MALPVPETLHLTAARFWRLLWNASPGRLGYALRVASACTVVVLVCEIWQVPDTAVPALVTLSIWKKDRVSNVLTGVIVNVIFAIIMLLMFGLVNITLDHPMALVITIALLALMFFFLGSASKLKPISYMMALIVIYAMIAIDKAPIGEIATRAILYADLFLLIPGATMVILGLIICPSPKTLLTQEIAACLKLSAQLLQNPTAILQEKAEDMLRDGATTMSQDLKMAKLEKIWAKHDLSCLHRAIYSSIGVLTLSLSASRTTITTPTPNNLINTLTAMADIFREGGYPTDIGHFTTDSTLPEHYEISSLLNNFSDPSTEKELENNEKSQTQKTGFFTPDAFTNPEHVRFAVKGTCAVMISYFIFKILNWPSIHTCIITCFIVALPTMGEMISKLTLRISGALVGGAMGIGSIVYLIPHLQDTAAFLATIAVASFVASWVKTGDARISYAGLQIGLAFFLSDLKGYGPTSDMTTARDRIIGILIGNFITYAVFTSVWPSSAYPRILQPLKKLSESLKNLQNSSSQTQALFYLAATQSSLGKTERAIEFATLEPMHMRAAMPELKTYQTQTQNAARLAEHALTHIQTTARPSVGGQSL